MKKITFLSLTLLAVLSAGAGMTALVAPAATAAAAGNECVSLRAELSDDKNYYSLIAAGNAADNTRIVGYAFDFGDRQSYTFSFDNRPGQDTHTATVRHTYRDPGTYTVKASVVTGQNGKKTYTSSESCQATITIDPHDSAPLPSTGPGMMDGALYILAASALGYGGMRGGSLLAHASLKLFISLHARRRLRHTSKTIDRRNRTHTLGS